MAERVVLDTNIFVANFHPSNAFKLLLEGSRSGQIVVIVPDLVIREAVNKYREQLSGKLRELEKVASALRRFDVHVDVPSRDEAEARALRYQRDLRRSLRDAGAVIPDLPDVSHNKLLQRALDRRKPFKERDAGYRDALLWETVLDQAKQGTTVLCTMNTRDFAQAESPDRLAAELTADVLAANLEESAVTLSSDLGALVAAVVDVEIAASEEVERALPRLLPDLERQVEAALYDYDFDNRELGSVTNSKLVDRDADFEVDHAEVIDAQLVAAFHLGHVAVNQVQVLSEDALLVTMTCDIDGDLDIELEIDGHDSDGWRRVMRSDTVTRTLAVSVDATFLRHDQAFVEVTVRGARA